MSESHRIAVAAKTPQAIKRAIKTVKDVTAITFQGNLVFTDLSFVLREVRHDLSSILVSGRKKNQARAVAAITATLIHWPFRNPSVSVNIAPKKEEEAMPIKNHICNIPLFLPLLSSVETSKTTEIPPTHNKDQAKPQNILPTNKGQNPRQSINHAGACGHKGCPQAH